jgi:hypothetical protein
VGRRNDSNVRFDDERYSQELIPNNCRHRCEGLKSFGGGCTRLCVRIPYTLAEPLTEFHRNNSMKKPAYLSLQHSESVIVSSATTIFSAYVSAGKVPEGDEQIWMKKAISEAIWIARATDAMVHSDNEMSGGLG